MLFNSFTFAAFFAVVLILHHLPLAWRAKKTNLLVASYLFYAAWNPPFVALLWISTLTDWKLGRKIHEASGARRRRLLVVCSLAVNLGLLSAFKYGQVLYDIFLVTAGSAGAGWSADA